ncbi:hypothetical protein, partial [Proteiniphilum sp. UBA5480]|uniref:hypothetical protein n=1 Tax=Proteiniphilum sp. UBA5480 TaxID=1947282 RepID=UPI00257C3B9C
GVHNRQPLGYLSYHGRSHERVDVFSEAWSKACREKSAEAIVVWIQARPGNLSTCSFLTDHYVGRFGEFPHGLQHVRYGAFTDVESEDGLEQMNESLERNILVSADVGCHRHDVGAEGYGSVHLFRELSLAAMPAKAIFYHWKTIHCGIKENLYRLIHFPIIITLWKGIR